MRGSAHISVLLGGSLPRQHKGEEENEQWCQAMLILFKPWREASEIKGNCTTWSEAFNIWFKNSTWKFHDIMANIDVEHECHNAHETYDRQRREGCLPNSLLSSFHGEFIPPDIASLSVALINDEAIPCYLEEEQQH